MKKIIIYCFCVFFLYSCFDKLNESKNKKKYFRNTIQQKNSFLNLNDISLGVDSLEIRIWNNKNNVNREVIILSYDDGWKSYKINYTETWTGRYDSINIITPKIEDLYINNSYSLFVNNLHKLNLFKIKKMSEYIEIEKIHTGGIEYVIEVSNRKDYNCFSFISPYSYSNNKGAKNFTRIIELFETNFEILIFPSIEDR